MTDEKTREPQERGRERRERILDAAFTTFAERGYRESAIDDIAHASETSKGGVYFHFATKDAIFRELMRTTADRLDDKVARAVADEPDPIAAAAIAVRTVLETFAGHRRMARLLFLDAFGAGRVFTDEVDRLHARFSERISGYLDRAVADGVIAPIDTRDRRPGVVRRARRDRRAVAHGGEAGAPARRLPDAARAPAPERRDRRSDGRDAPRTPGGRAMTVVEKPAPQPAVGGRRAAASRPASATWRARPTSTRPGPHRASARMAPRLLSATVAAPGMDPVALFAAARAAGLAPVLWIQPRDGLALVGIGEAWATEPAGAGRFAAADAAWTDLARGARVSDDSGPARGTGPLLRGRVRVRPGRRRRRGVGRVRPGAARAPGARRGRARRAARG